MYVHTRVNKYSYVYECICTYTIHICSYLDIHNCTGRKMEGRGSDAECSCSVLTTRFRPPSLDKTVTQVNTCLCVLYVLYVLYVHTYVKQLFWHKRVYLCIYVYTYLCTYVIANLYCTVYTVALTYMYACTYVCIYVLYQYLDVLEV